MWEMNVPAAGGAGEDTSGPVMSAVRVNAWAEDNTRIVWGWRGEERQTIAVCLDGETIL